MPIYKKIYNLPDTPTGNTFNGVNLTLPSFETFGLNGAKITMQVKTQPGLSPVKTFSTENGLIEIQSDYKFGIKAQIISHIPATYKYDILIEFADGRKKTYIGGQWTITPVITK
jgi:hypothetical protein